jgi:hypothetical protein
MLRKLQFIGLVGCLGLIGADRIDLFNGHGPFKLTPFLILAPLVVLIGFLIRLSCGSLHFTITPPIRRQTHFRIAFILLLLLSLASVPFSLDPERSLVAVAGFSLVVVLGYYISVQILAAPAQETLIVRSVTFALAVYVIFCIGQYIAWSHGVFTVPGQNASWTESMFAPGTEGFLALRLSGTISDANRAGFVLTMYLVLLDRFASKSRYTLILRFVIGFLVLLTISKSAILCWLVYYLFSNTFWKRLVSRQAVAWLAAIAIVGSFVWIEKQEEIVGLADTWEIFDVVSARTSMDPGSSGQDHILLIERGFDTWLTSTKTIIVGIGFGAAPKVLGDFFQDNKYGNFHCLYATVLAELGLPAFLVLAFLLGYPIIGRKGTLSCIAAIMIFNVGYQSHMEPVFWIVLALLWSSERRDLPTFGSLALDVSPSAVRSA